MFSVLKFSYLVRSYSSIWSWHPFFISNVLPFTSLILILTHQQQTAFENIVRKGEIVHVFDIISLFAAELEEPKTGKGLNLNKAEILLSSLGFKQAFS